METGLLINGLARDAKRSSLDLGLTTLCILALSVLVAGAVFFGMLGPRHDFAAAAQTWRFPFKFVVTLALTLAALSTYVAVARPGNAWRSRAMLIAAAPLMLAAAVIVEFAVMPPQTWEPRWIGTNSLLCLTFIPVIGVAPLALLLYALRLSAPTVPAVAGAVAGVLAGGIAATFYASHCFDDSPFFVATWYPLAIAILAVVGALAGRLFLRW